jgi:Domain of unknown function (DUF6438)
MTVVTLVQRVVVLALAGGLVAPLIAGRQEPGQGRPTPPPAVPAAYSFLYDSARARVESWPSAEKSIPIVAISIARKGCFGTCPVYLTTLRADGVATYVGIRSAPRTGNHAGKVFFGDFARLALFVEQSGFSQLAGRYTAPWTDDETVVVSVTWRDGTTKEVSNYGRFGPPNLWILEHAIDAVANEIKWAAS